MNIMQNRMDRGFLKYQSEFENKALEVMRSGWYVLGNEVSSFEEEFAEYIGGKYCVGLASGLDALWITFRLLGIGAGDEVIVQANTYIASVMGITMNGATPVFVDPDEYFGIDASKIEEKITPRTKAVLVVHLYGIPCNMTKIVDICKRHNLRLVEDCAQSHGAKYKGQMTGIFGDVGCFSFYPAKNLGAFGDAGAVVVNDEGLAKDFKVFRNYGSEKKYYNKVVGANSRLDELQAGLLRVKLKHLDEFNEERRILASEYSSRLRGATGDDGGFRGSRMTEDSEPMMNNKMAGASTKVKSCETVRDGVMTDESRITGVDQNSIYLPAVPDNTECVWHQYVIRSGRRDELAEYLKENGIGTIIHYPIPPHLSEAYSYLGHTRGELPITENLADTVLSIPMYNGMTKEEQDYVIEKLNAWGD